MRPSPIPDTEVWDGGRRIVIGPPGNDLDSDIAAVEVIVDQSAIGPRMTARCIVEPGDLDALCAGGAVWVSFYGGQLQPFSIDVQPPPEPRPSLRVTVETVDGTPEFKAFMAAVPDGMTPGVFLAGCAEALTAMAAEMQATERGSLWTPGG